LEVWPYFDRQAYHMGVTGFGGHAGQTSYFGGVRQRVFGGSEPGQAAAHFYCLNKVPLLRYDPSIELHANLHWVGCRELADETGVLLHFKFLSSFPARVREEVARKEHCNA